MGLGAGPLGIGECVAGLAGGEGMVRMIERPGAGRRESVQPSASWFGVRRGGGSIGLAGGDHE